MRTGTTRYPVDRYLVESSKNVEMVNIIDDELWNNEPALRPEDEIILRKLHDMLQSTADDLKLLSGELNKYHEPGVQLKTAPTPLDEEFNEKVHIEEVVNAKFHGYKIIEKTSHTPEHHSKLNNVANNVKLNNLKIPKNTYNNTEIKAAPIPKGPVTKNLGMSLTRIVQIEPNKNVTKNNKRKTATQNKAKAPSVTYNEITFKHAEPETSRRDFQVQEMPSINIRSELTEHKVLQLDILPEDKSKATAINTTGNKNVAVISIEHEQIAPITQNVSLQFNNITSRKISKMSTCESSCSTNNVSTDAQIKRQTQNRIVTNMRNSPKSSARPDRPKKSTVQKKSAEHRPHLNLSEWKKKLNEVYGIPSSQKIKSVKSKINAKTSLIKQHDKSTRQKTALNAAQYIPYSQFTLGGVEISDIEREITDIPNKNNIPLSPILDKLLSSRENSYSKDIKKLKDSPKILTTSDENLLQEVIDIEKTVSETLSKNHKNRVNKQVIKSDNKSNVRDGNFCKDKNVKRVIEPILNSISSSSKSNSGSYVDDFEEDKSEISDKSEIKLLPNSAPEDNISIVSNDSTTHRNLKANFKNKTVTKSSKNLSIKASVDIFEFVHSVDTQDSATQSSRAQKISLKETQTSPRNDRPNMQPIHNDLWPSIDPKGEVEKLFQNEKDFIKKLIIEEYGDLLEKNIAKPSTSEGTKHENVNNVAAYQKVTQTSPAHVKSVMTSPTKVKTRTTSPLTRSLVIDRHTSPIIVVTNEDQVTVEIENNDDLGISVNLSSPRFSLRLPQTSREVLSNLEASAHVDDKSINPNRIVSSSSTSIDADNSSSEISSLGEVKLRLRKKNRKNRVISISESTSSSHMSRYSFDIPSASIIPLRSEGEVSFGRKNKKSNTFIGSDGETSFGTK